MKLGKLEPRLDSRTFKLSKYISALPSIPDHKNWSNVPIPAWTMLGNDNYGDCTCAAACDIIHQDTSENNATFIPTTEQALEAYANVTTPPFDPVTGANDNGAEMLTVLNYWRNTGIAGRKIWAFASVNPANQSEVESAIYLFGSLYTGLALPVSAQRAVRQGGTWASRRGDKPGSWGGHCIDTFGYTADKLVVVTWAMTMYMTWGFFEECCDECYAVLTEDWVSGTKSAPDGFNLSQLEADLRLV